ncbi:hypothetical protein D3C73_1591510 [compost metagenome]
MQAHLGCGGIHQVPAVHICQEDQANCIIDLHGRCVVQAVDSGEDGGAFLQRFLEFLALPMLQLVAKQLQPGMAE